MAELVPRDLRADFPIFEKQGDGFIYLDSAATSQKPSVVIDAMTAYLTEYTSNVHRGVYPIAAKATDAYELARDKVKTFINARQREEVIFTSGTTEGANLVAYAWGLKGDLARGDRIVTTVMEHHSNTIPWYFLREALGVEIEFVDIREDGTLDFEQYEKLITPRTRLVTVTHVSNVLGAINPIREIAAMAHDVGALLFVDAAQSAPHIPLDVQALGCDFLAFSGHKMLGPTGIGVLYGRRAVLEGMAPFLGGGEMIEEVRLDGATWNELPWRLEAGTPKIAEAIGLGAAIDYLGKIGLDAVRSHEQRLLDHALEKLRPIDGLRIFGPSDTSKRGGVIAFVLDGVHPHDLSTAIARHAGVCVRAGHHCCQPLMRRLDVTATARASLYLYNDENDIDRLEWALRRAKDFD